MQAAHERNARSLDLQREEFARRRLIAMPIAGMLAWAIVGVCSLFFSPFASAMVLFAATGSIAYLGMFVSRFTGENFLDKNRPKNSFDALFFYSVGMSLLVYAIAIPFFLEDPSSLPLSVGILSGLMWLPISWIIQHWIGLAHGIARTVAVLTVWYLFPEQRILAVSLVIVALYILAIAVLEHRWRHITGRRGSRSEAGGGLGASPVVSSAPVESAAGREPSSMAADGSPVK